MYEKNRQELLELAQNLLEREEEPELPVISQVIMIYTLVIKIVIFNSFGFCFFNVTNDLTFIIKINKWA